MLPTNSLLLFLGCLCAAPLAAQPAGAERPFSRALTVTAGAAGGVTLSDNQGGTFAELDVQHWGTSFEQRLRWSETTFLTLQVQYDRYEFPVGAAVIPLPRAADEVGVQATIRQAWNDRWSFLGSVEPRWAGTDSFLSGDGFGVTVAGLALYRASESLTWGFGLLYRTPAENWDLVPAIGFDWRPTPDWTVSVAYPRSAVTYQAHEQVRVALVGAAHGGTFAVAEDAGRGINGAPDLSDTWLDYTEIRVGLGVDYRPVGAWELSALLGWIVYQDFDYYERDYRLEADDAAPFAVLSARYRF